MLLGNYNFRKDLKRERKVKKVYAKIAKRLDKNISLIEFSPTEKFSDWDLVQKYKNNSEQKIELKEDSKTKKTGNIFLEIESWGKPSGIQISKSDYYIFIVHTDKNMIEFLKIPTHILKKINCKKNRENKKMFKTCISNVKNGKETYHKCVGDAGSHAKGFILPKEKFDKYKIYSVKEEAFNKRIEQENE